MPVVPSFPAVVATKNVSRHWQASSGKLHHPRVRTTARALRKQCYSPQFATEDTEAGRGAGTWPRVPCGNKE